MNCSTYRNSGVEHIIYALPQQHKANGRMVHCVRNSKVGSGIEALIYKPPSFHFVAVFPIDKIMQLYNCVCDGNDHAANILQL